MVELKKNLVYIYIYVYMYIYIHTTVHLFLDTRN